jgi:hypothetical protein
MPRLIPDSLFLPSVVKYWIATYIHIIGCHANVRNGFHSILRWFRAPNYIFSTMRYSTTGCSVIHQLKWTAMSLHLRGGCITTKWHAILGHWNQCDTFTTSLHWSNRYRNQLSPTASVRVVYIQSERVQEPPRLTTWNLGFHILLYRGRQIQSMIFLVRFSHL